MPVLATITPGQTMVIAGNDTSYDTTSPVLYREGFNDTHSLHIGFRFLVPSSIDSSDIDKVEFRFYVANGFSNTAGFNMPLRVPRTEITTLGSGANNPMDLYDGAIASTTATVTDVIGTTGFIQWIELHADDVIAAIDGNPDHSTDGTWIGVVNHAPASGNIIWSINGVGATGTEPEMKISSPIPANFDASVSGISPSVTTDALLLDEGISYAGVSALGSGSGAGTYRFLDIYPARSGTPTENGWPVVVYVHGGRWITGGKYISSGENYLSRAFVDKLTSEGYTVVSVEYRKVQETINPAAIFNSFPQNMHDVYASLVWIEQNASTHDFDSERVVVSGHSAGGFLAAFAGIVANTGDSTTYNGSQNSSSDRPAGYGYSDSASPWQFDLDENGELSLTNPPIGIMIWDAPIDLYQATIIADPVGTANAQARKALMGEVYNQSVFANEDEADLNHYIAGDGTKYTSAQSSSNIPPIFFMYSTTQDVITNASSITVMSSALDSIGYDISTADGVLNTNGGLTRHSVARDHEDVLRDQAPDFTEELAWLNQVSASSSNTHYVGTTAVTKMYVGSTEITKAYLGSTEIWP